ncbi:endocuticle structural glycoprotein SgAbd-9-like [Homalodisca vitripennis]|uniref:endocuticle structural glycoprotein SgAbd-9-like n=1 Tax=Homalodisca vitripennis TaxID=197043 RepID=UPI001EEAF3BC|nr:endocuticle structural glycoprotein SgAbd-9-like [Homalodisca vitripennis]
MSSSSAMDARLGSLGNLVCIFLIIFVLGGANGGVFVPILQQDQELNPDGSYRYSYATANGIMAAEQGKLQRPGSPEEAQTVEGSYTYLNSDGTLVNVRYTADHNGFRAVPNVVYRPEVLQKSSASGTVLFQTYNDLRQALTVR